MAALRVYAIFEKTQKVRKDLAALTGYVLFYLKRVHKSSSVSSWEEAELLCAYVETVSS